MPYLAPFPGHPDQFLRAQIGGQEGEAGDPDWDGMAGCQEVAAGRDLLAQDPSDAEDEGEIQRQNDVVNGGQFQSRSSESNVFSDWET